MSSTNGITSNGPSMDADESWRETFRLRIMDLSQGQIDSHQLTEWTTQAQQMHGERDAFEVATEAWGAGAPPSSA
jgi:activator of HSP90 ATPase